MIDKSYVRKTIKEKRNLLTAVWITEHSELICKKILDSEAYKDAASVFCYYPLPGEVSTLYIMNKILEAGKQLALPKVQEREMIFYRIDDFSQLEAGYMNIKEPDSVKCSISVPDDKSIMIMPGIAYDNYGHRVGYGGGYYDRYLSKHKNVYTIAPVFDFQILNEEIQNEKYDIKPDLIVSE